MLRLTFLTFFCLTNLLSMGQGFLWSKASQNNAYVFSTSSGAFSANASALANGKVTYKLVNIHRGYTMSNPGQFMMASHLYCLDSLGNLSSAAPLVTGFSSMRPMVIDHNNTLHAQGFNSTIGSMGGYSRQQSYIAHFTPTGSSVSAFIASSMQGNPDLQVPNRLSTLGIVAVDNQGHDYISVSTIAFKQTNGALVSHSMYLQKFTNSLWTVSWRKFFQDTATSSSSGYNKYFTIGCSNNVLLVRSTLLRDTFLYDGNKYVAKAGYNLLKFDTAGNYLGYVPIGQGVYDAVKPIFDNSGNLYFSATLNSGQSLQLDTALTVTMPSMGVRHSIIARINMSSGKCEWYSSFLSLAGSAYVNTIKSAGSGRILFSGTTDTTMLLNGGSNPFSDVTFWGSTDSMGAISVAGTNPIPVAGMIEPISAYQRPSGEWELVNFIQLKKFAFSCDSVSEGSVAMSLWSGSPSGTPKPTVSSSNTAVYNTSPTSVTLRWKKGDGRARIVVVREVIPVNGSPVDGLAYRANAFFGSGDTIAAGNYVVYNGLDSFVTIKGLKSNTIYCFRIIEYNGCNANTAYQLNGDTSSFTTSSVVYYTRSTGALNDLSAWGHLPDGSGNCPSSLSLDSVTYYIVNNPLPFISTDSILFWGLAGKVVLGDSISAIHLTIPDSTNFIVKNLRIAPHSTLTIEGSLTGIGSLFGDSLSELVYKNTRTFSAFVNAHNVEVIASGNGLVSNAASITVRNRLTLNGNIRVNEVTIGTDSVHPGELIYVSGAIAGGSVKRYIRSAVTNTGEGLFPHALYDNTTLKFSKRFLNLMFTDAPTRGGVVSVTANPYTFTGKGLPLSDTTGADSAVITRLNDVYWTIAAGNLTGGKFEIELFDSNARGDSLRDLRVIRYGGSSVMYLAGKYTFNTGSPNFPVVRSSECASLLPGSLYNYFFTGIDDTSLYKYLLGKPTIQATNFRVANVHSNKILLRWNRGNGYKCMVIARRLNSVNAFPVDSVSYNAYSGFGSGSNLGSQNFVVYNGVLDSVWVTSLANNTRYHFAVLEYNGYSGNERYLTIPLATTTDSTRSYTHYFNKPGLPINLLSTWGMKPDGSGDTLKAFSMSDVFYNLVNGSSVTFTDTLLINPTLNTNPLGSRFYVGSGTRQIVFNIAQQARLHMGTNLIVFLADSSKMIVNGGFSCKTMSHSSPGYNAELELNSSEMVNSISPVYASASIWTIPKLKVKGQNYYELPVIQVIDSCELDAMVKGTLVMNNRLSGTTVLKHISGGATDFGHIFNSSAPHYFPTVLIDNVGGGYRCHSRPIEMKCTFAPSASCNDPFIMHCMNNLSFINQISGFPKTDSSVSPMVSINKLYDTRTTWTGSFGFYSQTTCRDKQTFDVWVTDTVLPQLTDTHALAVWTHVYHPSSYPAHLYGNRTPYSINNGKITAARSGIYFVWAEPFGAITFGLAVDSSRQQLPVSWLSFTGSKQNENVLLKWSTASEQNNSHFEIERSADGYNFTYVGRKDGKGTTNSISDYGFTDRDAFSLTQAQVLYYRLKQVDFNGNYEYSRTIAINSSGQSMGRMELITYPNPFTEQLNLTLNNVSEGAVVIEVYDLSGRKHYSNVQFAGQGSLTLDLSGLSILNRGVYIIHVQNGNISLAHKLVKL